MDVRLYGRFSGYGSHAQVSYGFQSALMGAGVAVHPLDTTRIEEEGYVAAGAFAAHGVYTGELRSVGLLQRNARHAHRTVMVAPNCDTIPDRLAAAIAHTATGVITPSGWAADVLERYFPQVGFVQVVRHGVHPGFQHNREAAAARRAEFKEGFFRVVHLSSSETDRKGTLALLQAWQGFRDHSRGYRAKLHLVLDAAARIMLGRAMVTESVIMPEDVVLVDRLNLAPTEMAVWLQQFHVVCQPSRGEAFGMVPLEARACGVPVVFTGCTGHSEQLSGIAQGVVMVPYGPLVPLDEAPGGKAPRVTPVDIETSLLYALETWDALSLEAAQAANNIREEWSWERQLAPWIDQLEELTTP
jgi:glycosyltransferase involved in cell wall biosynthesis